MEWGQENEIRNDRGYLKWLSHMTERPMEVARRVDHIEEGPVNRG